MSLTGTLYACAHGCPYNIDVTNFILSMPMCVKCRFQPKHLYDNIALRGSVSSYMIKATLIRDVRRG